MDAVVKSLLKKVKRGELAEGVTLVEAWRQSNPTEDIVSKVLARDFDYPAIQKALP